jgi:hypothetical protein
MRPATTRSYFTSIGVGVAATIVAAVFSLRAALPHDAPADTTANVAAIAVWVERSEGSRDAAPRGATTSLHPDDRVRIDYAPGEHRFVYAFSVDERGKVSSLDPSKGRALGLPGQGRERLFIGLTDAPLDATTVARAARAAFERAGRDPAGMTGVDLPGEQLDRLFIHVEAF